MNIESEKIDDLINRQYIDISNTGELNQLARLFSIGFISDLLKIISDRNSSARVSSDIIEINLCWIDKRPLADFTKQKIIDHNNNIISQKVEIADAAFFFFNEIGYLDNGIEKITREESLSFMFQAKRAKSTKLPAIPIGTSTSKNNSTAKEYALLSKWPTFDLYKTSANKNPIYQDLKIDISGTTTSPYGWFGACPPTKVGPWKSRWMCAPAQLQASCDFTLGELIIALINRKTLGGVNVGESFIFDPTWQSGNNKNNLNSWDVLNNEILYQCKISQLPKSIFNNSDTRLVRVRELVKLNQQISMAIIENPDTTKINNFLTQRNEIHTEHNKYINNNAMPVLIFSRKMIE